MRATRYALPLREGGSLPGLVEADDDGLYVVKFRGAGQGPKALVAEVVAGEIARAAGFAVPEIVLVDVDPIIAAAEPDPEIQELVQASGGLNAAPGLPARRAALHARPRPSASTPSWPPASSGSTRCWPTSTARRATPTCWSGTGGCGSSTTAPRCTATTRRRWPHGAAAAPFPQIADHVLLPFAGSILDADARLAPRLGERRAAGRGRRACPTRGSADDPDARRAAYVTHLRERLTAPRAFAAEAEEARVPRA